MELYIFESQIIYSTDFIIDQKIGIRQEICLVIIRICIENELNWM